MKTAQETTEAEVQCQTCKKTKWVDFSDRYAGSKRKMDDVTKRPYVRCGTCPMDQDYTEYTGRTRQKEEETSLGNSVIF